MPEENWFSVINEIQELEQGDILPDVQYVLPQATDSWEEESPPVELYRGLVIVLSHSCDLAIGQNRHPDSLILVAAVYKKSEISQVYPSINSEEMLESIRLNVSRNYFMFPTHSGGPLGDEICFAALKSYGLVPRTYLEQKAVTLQERLRLKSPMRESLGSAFGGQFSRVAIDSRFEIPEFDSKPTAGQKAINSMHECSRNERTEVIQRFVSDGPHNRRTDPTWLEYKQQRGL
ncbi:MAG TPA: hypothetical protein VGL56_14920 [Fimbriimonadaceae bacterium]